MAGRRRLVTLLVSAFFLASAAAGSKPSAKFELIHRDPAPWDEVARMDQERTAFICSHARRRATEAAAAAPRGGTTKHYRAAAADEAFAMPLSSGAYTGTGQYFVRFRVGTPARPFLLVADTGSDLTWVKCHRHDHDVPVPAPAPAPGYNYGYGAPASSNDSSSSSSSLSATATAAASSHARVFRPDRSRTWAPIPCSSDTCTASLPFSLAACPTPGSPCAYDYRYKDGSAARGTVGTDSATIALSSSGRGATGTAKKRRRRQAKLRGVVLGCTTSYNGESFLASDGVLSLGYSNISFASRAAARFGGRFSYCLVDHLAPRNATSYLTFGPNPAVSSSSASNTACAGGSPPAPGSARQTPLLLDHRMRPFYAVTVNGISVDGELLKIPRLVWDVEKGGGAILDSGTSLTVLVTPAYRAVVAALSKKLAGVPRVTMDPFDYCYNWTSPSTGEDLTVPIPELAVHFAGSARLQPPAKSYVIDAAPGVKCIGLQEGDWPGVSVIGNILQQEHLWEFDLKNRRLRFKRSRCTQ